MAWLVTGGAGYIGAHVVEQMRRSGRHVLVMDDLSTGDRQRVPTDVAFEFGSVSDPRAVERVFGLYPIAGVVHLAAKKRCEESIEYPLTYFHQNVEALRLVLAASEKHEVRHFVFSSSAAVYGAQEDGVFDERSICSPLNVYGQTKLAGEWLTHAVGAATGMATVALRYFNVAGALSPEFADNEGENLVSAVLRALASGHRPAIFGDDYPTPDGTCIRDYVHVCDVAAAHLSAISALESGRMSGESLNIGTGIGASVREVIRAALRITNRGLNPLVRPRRPGDTPVAVAAVDRAVDVLQWKARYGLSDMIESAWQASRAAGGDSIADLR